MKNPENEPYGNQAEIEVSLNLVRYYNNIGETQMNQEENKQNLKEEKVCSLKGAIVFSKQLSNTSSRYA
jgi:hypothetical protein